MGQLTELNDDTVYVAEPSGTVRGGIVLIHEIWGLLPHITDVADRLAAEGYRVVAPDLLSHAGIPPEVGAELLRLRTSVDPAEQARVQPLLRERMVPVNAPDYGHWAVRSLKKTVDHLAEQPGVDGRLAVIGFCFGGSYAFALAAADARVGLAVPFYGAPPELNAVGLIGCPVLAFYGDQDTRLISGLPEVTQAMDAGGVDFTTEVYPGVGHAFFNDTNPHTYDAGAASDAWAKTLAALEERFANG